MTQGAEKGSSDKQKFRSFRNVLVLTCMIFGGVFYVYRLWGVGASYLLYADVYIWASQSALGETHNPQRQLVLNAMGEGCNQLLLEQCVGLSITYKQFHDNEFLTRVVDSVRDPCRYLVDPHGGPQGFRPLDSDWQAQSLSQRAWEQAHCSGQPLDVKVVLNVVDERNSIVLRLVKP